jgi:hypothetical protein
MLLLQVQPMTLQLLPDAYGIAAVKKDRFCLLKLGARPPGP